MSKHITQAINFKDYRVFDNASVHTSIIFANKNPKTDKIYFFEKTDKTEINKPQIENGLKSFTLSRKNLSEDWVIAENRNLNLIKKVEIKSDFLGDLAVIEKGSTSGKNKVFTVTYKFAKENNFEIDLLKKNVKSGDIGRYSFKDRNNYLIYIDSEIEPKKYPNIFSYLSLHRKELSARNEVKKGLYSWYRLERPRRKEVFDTPEKLIVPYRAERNKFAYDDNQHFNDGGDIRAIVLNEGIPLNIKYILGILNSKLMNWYYGFIGKPKGKMREYFNEPMSKIPIRTIDFNNPSEKAIHDKLVSLVDRMLELHKNKNSLPPSAEREKIEREIVIIDEKIDEIVYALYGVTEEETGIIEGS